MVFKSKNEKYFNNWWFGLIGTALAKKIIKENKGKLCILLDNFGGYINPSIGSFYDYRKLRLQAITKINIKLKELIQ